MVFVYVTLNHLRKNKIALVSFLSIKADYFVEANINKNYIRILLLLFLTKVWSKSMLA